jgi:Leucine-rich repeat (LRR) protein
MKKLYLLLSILFLIYWGCEEEQEVDTTPTEVTLWGEVYSVEDTTELDLGHNGLTGSIPPEIGNLTNLTKLILEGNQLSGSIPPEIGNLINLTELCL